MSPFQERYEAVVIGSGFGGAISACRLSRRWPGEVLVVERGKRYPLGSFPRTPHAFAHNFWNLGDEPRERPKKMRKHEKLGLFDIRNYDHMDVVLSAGLGGGSLIYANVFMEPPEQVFDDRWPRGLNRAALAPYYRIAKEVLGSRPVPPANGDPRRDIKRLKVYADAAKKAGRTSRLTDINVFFGNDFANPLAIGEQALNRYGALQTSCVYCAECDVGCNTQSKNTLDLNYLYVAETKYGARIETEHRVDRFVPVDASGCDDPQADGSHGYRVWVEDLRDRSRDAIPVLANRVVVSAGTLGSTELLLRAQKVHGTLPRLSQRLGQRFSGNGDFLSFVFGGAEPADPNHGPVITQATDFNLFDGFDRDHAFLLEDASYPAFLAWFAEGAKPGFLRLGAIGRTLRELYHRWIKGESTGPVGETMSDLMSDDLSYHTSVLLCMGLDRANGTMSLDRNGWTTIDWPLEDSRPLYDAILNAGKAFMRSARGDDFQPLPIWDWPMRKNVTVHPLGGCVLADDAAHGVTSADRATFGQVFGYHGLYVADGAVVPTAVGANPTATISALTEMIAEGITGRAPDADL